MIDVYAVCGWLEVLGIGEETRQSLKWDREFFDHLTRVVLGLSKEPSVKRMSRHLVVYGERYRRRSDLDGS